MPSPGPHPRPRGLRIRTGPLVLAGALALLAVAATAPAGAGTIRQAEWPLDGGHFQAEKVWRLSQGEGVTVAVVDSGVDARHPDLAGQVLPGAGFLGDTHDDGRTDTSRDSHGTAISGIIAGTGKADGGTGMIGLAPKAAILPVRITLGAAVEATALAEGIKYAADHHAQVINVSLGTPAPDPLLRQAVTYALDKGAVLVASAGNDGQNGNPPQYPAAFPGVVDVTGITGTGAFWPVSESGPGTTLATPATGIYSTSNRGQYVNAEGTSYAAAYVSAAAALVRSAHPELTAGQTIRRLITTAHRAKGRPSHSDQFGYGSLDPLAALQAPATTTGDPANPLLAAHPLGSPAHHHGRRWIAYALAAALAAAIVIGSALVVRNTRRRRAAPDGGGGSTRTRGAPAPERRKTAGTQKKKSSKPSGKSTVGKSTVGKSAVGKSAVRSPKKAAKPQRGDGNSTSARPR